MSLIKVGNIEIGLTRSPFIIAEMSGNHNQSIERALSIVKAAADAGADAIKLQTYTPDSLTIDVQGGLFDINDKKSLWNGKNLYQLYQEAMTPYEWHKRIFEYAKSLGILCFSTPFDENGVDFLEELEVPCYKIASFENNHHPLLKRIASKRKPIIMSTGISTLSDIDESVKILKDSGNTQLVLLKCTSTYPATPENTNLKTIPHMRQLFDCEVGLSDHTMGVGAAVAAIALGATVIEKHFCLSRAEGGVDSAFSLEPHEFKLLVTEAKRAHAALGEIQYGIQEAEKNSLNFKRSIYVVENIKKGDFFSEENLKIIRPGDGLHPRFLDKIVGKQSKNDIPRGTPLRWDFI